MPGVVAGGDAGGHHRRPFILTIGRRMSIARTTPTTIPRVTNKITSFPIQPSLCLPRDHRQHSGHVAEQWNLAEDPL
jgi:hypothetical protein